MIYDLRSKGGSACRQAGFTLIEVLIAIGIMVLIAAVAIPNLRSFREDTVLSQAAQGVSSGLKKVQANAQSGVKCQTGTISSSWSIYFIPQQKKFELICNYESEGSETSVTEETSLISDVNMTVACGEDEPPDTKITFTSISIGKSEIVTPCDNDSIFMVSLESQKTGQSKEINIDSNGIIFEN